MINAGPPAGVYSHDQRQLYDLKDPSWKHDIMPEV